MIFTKYNADELYGKIKILNEVLWNNDVCEQDINVWLKNFIEEKEQYHALYLLSQFMYFKSSLIRELLKALYRDLYKYRAVEIIRKDNDHTIDGDFIEDKFKLVLSNTRFLGIGNPSESGVHLLYYFRQENDLPRKLFINTHDIFKNGTVNDKLTFENSGIDHYVFIDDFCGSGSQAKRYSKKILKDIKEINRDVRVDYISLFSTTRGIESVRKETLFDYVDSVLELDETFECFGDNSRYFRKSPDDIDKNYAESMCRKYGELIMEKIFIKEGELLSTASQKAKNEALGFKNGQQLIGLFHNTPNNTMPIFWCDESKFPSWNPIHLFKRYHKVD
jgi:hypothetical protein